MTPRACEPIADDWRDCAPERDESFLGVQYTRHRASDQGWRNRVALVLRVAANPLAPYSICSRSDYGT